MVRPERERYRRVVGRQIGWISHNGGINCRCARRITKDNFNYRKERKRSNSLLFFTKLIHHLPYICTNFPNQNYSLPSSRDKSRINLVMKIIRVSKIYIAYAVDRDPSESSKRGDSSRCVSSSGKQKLRKTIVFSKCSCLITRYTKSFSLLFPKSGRYFSFIQGARAKFLQQTYPFRDQPRRYFIGGSLSTHHESKERPLLVGLNFFPFSFFLVAAYPLSNQGYIYIPAFPILLDLCSLSRVDFFSNFLSNIPRRRCPTVRI